MLPKKRISSICSSCTPKPGCPICEKCEKLPASVKRSGNGSKLCNPCFTSSIESEIHETILQSNIISGESRWILGVSGGKDSTVLAHILDKLQRRYPEIYKEIRIEWVCIDEGISGYRDLSLEVVEQNSQLYPCDLHIYSFKELFGYSLDEVCTQIKKGMACTYCGVFRRTALERAVGKLQGDLIVTGHNADDLAETLYMNVLRGDTNRINHSVSSLTGDLVHIPGAAQALPRFKPMKYIYEKEIVLYAHIHALNYFSVECPYAHDSFRAQVRVIIKNLEKIHPPSILAIIHSGENIKVPEITHKELIPLGICEDCRVHSQLGRNSLCKACELIRELNKGKPKIQLEFN